MYCTTPLGTCMKMEHKLVSPNLYSYIWKYMEVSGSPFKKSCNWVGYSCIGRTCTWHRSSWCWCLVSILLNISADGDNVGGLLHTSAASWLNWTTCLIKASLWKCETALIPDNEKGFLGWNSLSSLYYQDWSVVDCPILVLILKLTVWFRLKEFYSKLTATGFEVDYHGYAPSSATKPL